MSVAEPRMPDELSDLDLTDLTLFEAGFPHRVFDRLRREAPVWWHAPTEHTPDREGFWVVSRYADVLRVFLDAESYSSVTGGQRPYGGTFIQDNPAAGVMLNMMDDPRHQRIRQLVNKGFTPRRIGDLEGELRGRARTILESVSEAESCDFVGDVARELPLQAICMLLGIPQEDRGPLCDWLDDAFDHDGRDLGESNPRSESAFANLSAYANDLIAEKRATPRDDILSVVIHASLPDESMPRLTDSELMVFFHLLFVAGSETTRKTIAGSLHALIEDENEMAVLRADPGLLETTAIEEMVRFTTPSVYKRRTVARDVVLGEQKLAAGDKVTIWEMSANRDETVFTAPHRLDLRRTPNPHLGFGQGVHYCLGANLARLEIRVLFEELLPRFHDIERIGAPTFTRDNRLFGLKHLPIRYRTSS